MSSLLWFLSTICSHNIYTKNFKLFVIFCVISSAIFSSALPIDTIFKLPNPAPAWPQGTGFGSGSVDIGGLRVKQVSSFTKIWAAKEWGQDNQGITYFEPSPIPDGFFMLAGYAQPNRRPLSGWVLVGQDLDTSSLRPPINYTMFWASDKLGINQDGIGYFWLPVAPPGYKPVGYVVTATPKMPSFDRIRCVRENLTDEAELGDWMFSGDGLNVFEMRPRNRGVNSTSVSVGTYVAQYDWEGLASKLPLSCLKATSPLLSLMPNVDQVNVLIQSHAPLIYFHTDEEYLPSSIAWFFTNGALLYSAQDSAHPVRVNPNGSNLPQDGSDDEKYWVDLPVEDSEKDGVKRGELESTEAYCHVKPALGGTFTDIAMWVFYPFNGPIRLKIKFMTIALKKVGQHVGDWEHVTLRISNFNGELYSVFFSQHSGGEWVSASDLEYYAGNKFVAYSSLHGHALYPNPGTVLQGKDDVGIRNDASKSDKMLNASAKYSIIAAEYLGTVKEPMWVNYKRKWGPKLTYNRKGELEDIKKLLIGKVKKLFQRFLDSLPQELFGEEGPSGPKSKNSWNGDEPSTTSTVLYTD